MKKAPTRSAQCVRKTGLQVSVRRRLRLLPALTAPVTTRFPGAQPLPSFHMKTLLAERALSHSLLRTPPLVRGSPRGRGLHPSSRAAGCRAGSLVSEARVGEESHTSKSCPCAHVLGMGAQRNACVSHDDKPKLQTERGRHLGRAAPAGPRANVAESFAQREGGRCPRASPAPRLLWEQTLP